MSHAGVNERASLWNVRNWDEWNECLEPMRYARAVGCSAAASDVERTAKEIAFLGQASQVAMLRRSRCRRLRKAQCNHAIALHQSAQISPI
jgi:hypothetical protein